MSDYIAANLLLDQLAAEGTSFIFGSPGWSVKPLISALSQRSDLKYISSLHEGITVSMAAGYAQASGKVGVINLNTIAGLSNGLSALINAASSRIPLVVTVGQHDSRLLNDLPNSHGQLCSLVDSFSKWSCELKSAEELPRVLRRAFHEAMSPPFGVSVVSLPENIMQQVVSGKIIVPAKSSPLASADSSFLKRVANLLVSAVKPAVIAGNEIGQYHARQEIVSLVEVLGCPAFCEPRPTTVNFPNQHQLFAGILPIDGKRALDLLKHHDVILVCGMQTRTPQSFQEHGFIAPTTVVAQINTDASLAGVGLPCHFSSAGDLRESLAKLRAEVQLLVDTNWVSNSRVRSRSVMEQIIARKNTAGETSNSAKDHSKISAANFLSLLDTLKPAKSVLFNDLDSMSDLPLAVMKFERSRSYCAGNAGLPGYAIAAAMGAYVSDPECTPICLTDDNSFLCYPQALWTAASYQLPAKIIVFNQHEQQSRLAKTGATPVSEIGLVQLAASMSIPGQSISLASQIEPALAEMFANPGAYMLDVRI
jgi:benzoylformate decarboxylase